MEIIYIDHSEIKIALTVSLPNHLAPVCLGPADIDRIKPLILVIPGALYLDSGQSAIDIDGQIIWEAISDRTEDLETSPLKLGFYCRFRYVGLELRIHVLSLTSYRAALPRNIFNFQSTTKWKDPLLEALTAVKAYSQINSAKCV